jgi:hypothetical protein
MPHHANGNVTDTNNIPRDIYNVPTSSTGLPSMIYAATPVHPYDQHHLTSTLYRASTRAGLHQQSSKGRACCLSWSLVFPQPQVTPVEVVMPGDVEGEGEDDFDNKRYCICDGISYGK